MTFAENRVPKTVVGVSQPTEDTVQKWLAGNLLGKGGHINANLQEFRVHVRLFHKCLYHTCLRKSRLGIHSLIPNSLLGISSCLNTVYPRCSMYGIYTYIWLKIDDKCR